MINRAKLRAIVGPAAVAAALAVTATVVAAPAHAYDPEAPTITTKNPTIGARGLYIIQDGDTLWDLCDIFFSEPWYWPTLWSYNPQLTNPHWVFPGDMIQIRKPQLAESTTIVWSESRYSKRKADLEILARYVGYLPDRPFRESGRIAFARESHVTLGEFDEIYIEFGVNTNVKRGERFTIYRGEGELEHPLDDDILVGHKIRHLGVAKVLNADKKYIKALITRSYEEIQRGDLITSAFPHSWLVGPVTNESEIVATLVDYHQPMQHAGQYQYVYIDKGRNDGVRRGNRFVITRRGDGLWFDGDPDDSDIAITDFPWEHIGEVMVVEAFEDTSLAIVSRTIKELVRGDRLVMEKDY